MASLAACFLSWAATAVPDLAFEDLLAQAAGAKPAKARVLLRQAAALLQTSKDLDRQQRKQAWRRWADLFEAKATTQDEVIHVLGNDAVKSVNRQVLFHGYLEQWSLREPVGLVLIFECIKGKEPRLRSIQLRLSDFDI